VTVRLAENGIRVVLLDIEGTTTPIAFVHDVLFPYARTNVRSWLDQIDRAVRTSIVSALRAEYEVDRQAGASVPEWPMLAEEQETAAAAAYAHWLMDLDRKSPALKRLQGLVWERGYQAGELRGEIYEDVPSAIQRWHRDGLAVAIYSSGSVLAQRRLFESTEAGDLTVFISGFFDTAVGHKMSSGSYERIAGALRIRPSDILFVSDVVAELRAARNAGCRVALSLRPGNPPQPDASDFAAVRSFDEIA
jgi:enolase-phosphatase E1